MILNEYVSCTIMYPQIVILLCLLGLLAKEAKSPFTVVVLTNSETHLYWN